MGIKISELPSGPAEQTAVAPATNAAGTVTSKVTLMGIASLATKQTVGLGNVDNTSDANKPVSNAMQTALNAIQAITGTQGIQGITGSQGTQGITGSQGTQGITGSQGTQGITGSQGTQGITGSQGTQGITGSQGTQGIQGITGSQGTQGSQGIQGITGSQGIQGVQGTEGSQGIQGITGSQGIQGVQGTEGSQGIQGITGSQGIQGITGSQGVTGSQGIQGIQGIAVATNVIAASIVSSIVDTDASAGAIFDVTATENFTLANPTNPTDGKSIRWRIKQDATGGREITLGTQFKIPSSANPILLLSTAANATDLLAATYCHSRVEWDIIAFVKGY